MVSPMSEFVRLIKGKAIEAVHTHKLSYLHLSCHNLISDGNFVIGKPTRQKLKKLKENQHKA